MTSVSPRRAISLDGSARFRFGDAVAGIETAEFDDSSWDVVPLPHSWNGEDATSRAPRRGVGWYRLRFRAPRLAPGSRVHLRFGGVSLLSTVWLNGVELGGHESGTSAFCLAASHAIRTAADNVVVIRADNTAHDDVLPREGDFTMCGGLYRAASCVVTAPLSIDALDHAGPGVYLSTPDLDSKRGRVRARVRVRNAELRTRSSELVLSVVDADSRVVAEARSTHTAAFGVTEAVLDLEVDAPRRWHGVRDPYLYRVLVELHADGELSDRVEQPLGFRSFRLDPEAGFFLNEERYELWGTNLHNDVPGKGWAISREDRERDFGFLVEMGATFVRLAHYQHDAHAHELADRLGLVVWAEHALVNTVSASPRFSERAAAQLTDLIRQSYNHPSIAFWGIGNEVQTHRPTAAEPLLRRLAALVKTEDPTRLSALATCFDEAAGAYGVDLLAHNRYFGWYLGCFEDFPRWLDAQRAKAPEGVIGMSEYGAGAGVHTHTDAPKALDHSEEHQALFHEAYFEALSARPWVACRAVWHLFDFASSGRDEGEAPGINDKGLVTRDRETRKDAFFWYRANLTREPLVYIASRRFTERHAAKTAVKVYSNLEEVELRINGRTRGVGPVQRCIALFHEVELEPGENRVEVEARAGTRRVSDACSWTLLA